MSAETRLVRSSVASSRRRCSVLILRRKSALSFSSRAAKSRTSSLRRFSSSMVCSTPRWLLTVFPDLRYDFVQLFDYCDGLVHAGQEFFDVEALELLALGVFPILFGLLPLQGQSLGERRKF